MKRKKLHVAFAFLASFLVRTLDFSYSFYKTDFLKGFFLVMEQDSLLIISGPLGWFFDLIESRESSDLNIRFLSFSILVALLLLAPIVYSTKKYLKTGKVHFVFYLFALSYIWFFIGGSLAYSARI